MELSNESLQWAQRLVRINTVSRESNLPLIECIADHLRALDVPIRLTYDSERRKANLFATIGVGKPDGVILFSNNYQRFKLDAESLAEFEVQDLSRKTLPEDFRRNPRIHVAYSLRRKAARAAGG